MSPEKEGWSGLAWLTFVAFLGLLVLGVLLLSGCGGNMAAAVTTANVAAQVEVTGGEVLKEECLPRYQRATATAVPDVDRVCLAPTKALAALRGTRLVLLSAIAVAQAAGQDSVPPAVIVSAAKGAAAVVDAVQKVKTP